MALAADLQSQARQIFKKLYQNRGLNVEASKQTLNEQVELYLNHLSSHIGKKISEKDQKRIISIIERNDEVSKILKDESYKKIVNVKRYLLGDVAVGLIFCIDGRIPTIFLGGRFVKHWEVPAGEIVTGKRLSDKKLIPESTALCEAIRNMVNMDQDLLEIVFAHTSFLGHGCGAMAAKKKNGVIPDNISLEEANLKIIEDKTIPAITYFYNDLRTQKGLEPLTRVGVSALYDTDTGGIVLNYDKKADSLSTTELTNKYKDSMDEIFIKKNLVFGSFKEKFSELKYLTIFSQNLLDVTQSLLSQTSFEQLSSRIDLYLAKFYSDLTKNQQKALKFFIVRAIAFQYLTGMSAVTKKTLDHPFSEHEEEFMAVSLRGATIGKFDPLYQGFSSTPADAETAIRNIKTKLSIMESTGSKKNKPYILFVCNPANAHDAKTSNDSFIRSMTSNADLFRSIIADKTLREMVENASLIPVPVLLDQHTREVLKIIDHAAYI